MRAFHQPYGVVLPCPHLKVLGSGIFSVTKCFSQVHIVDMEQDIDAVITYLVEKLFAPEAAETLLNEFDKAAAILQKHPYAFPLYQARHPLEFEIRKILVKNFILFYAVLEETVEIHRFIYGKRNLSALSMDGELS